MAATLGKIWFQYKHAFDQESPHELEGCLHVLHSVLTVGMADERVRLTIHVPVDGGQYLQQIVEYVGDRGPRRKAGRKLPVQCGIIGKAYRERSAVAADRTNFEEEAFVRELVEQWNFSDEDAREVDPYTKTWLAVPIMLPGSENPVHGIVFADSTIQGFFDSAKQDIVFSACAGIAKYVVRRYK